MITASTNLNPIGRRVLAGLLRQRMQMQVEGAAHA